jgi:hypothetical protein
MNGYFLFSITYTAMSKFTPLGTTRPRWTAASINFLTQDEMRRLLDGIPSKPRQNILYTSAEINRLYSAPECLYAVYTSSKSHNCSAGNSNRA